MKLKERSISIPAPAAGVDILQHMREGLEFHLKPNETPIRIAVTKSDEQQYECELGVIVHGAKNLTGDLPNLFNFNQRKSEAIETFNAVFLVPTGIGAEIGGHAGDASVVARLLAQNCDTLITHPNAVNASDINEMPENSMYVEGSVITRMMMGVAGLQPVRSNRVLVMLDTHPVQHFVDAAINSVNAGRATYGLNASNVVCLNPSIKMVAEYSESGCAVGTVSDLNHCLEVLKDKKGSYDAVAFSSVIQVPFSYHLDYFESAGEMINPWGGVEAMLTHAISSILDIPTAHAPMFENKQIENLETGVIDPRMSAEAVSMCFIQCILKGLQRSPKLVTDREAMNKSEVITAENISCLIIPDGCLGLPTLAALYQGIPVIAVRDNTNLMENNLSNLPWNDGQLIMVDNYLEAVGVMAALKAGVTMESVRRPLASTEIQIADQCMESASKSAATD